MIRVLYFSLFVLIVVSEAVKKESDATNANAASGSTASSDGNLAEDKKAAAELQAKIQEIHKNDPRNSLQLAQDVLSRAFEKYNAKRGGDEVMISALIEKLGDTLGKTTLYLFRLFSFMDTNMDYKISKKEFANFYMGPAASPGQFVDLLLKVQDLNQDGELNAYEYLWSEVMSLGINYNLFDMWRSANQKLNEVDINDDGVVDSTEWGHYVLFQINKALVEQRAGLYK